MRHPEFSNSENLGCLIFIVLFYKLNFIPFLHSKFHKYHD